MEHPRGDTGLKRRLGLGSATSIVVANMIGAGIFTTSGLLMASLGDPRVMIGLWVVGGVIALCGALCFGELGAAMPEAGGEYVFLSRLYHPLLGFLTGWVSFFAGFSAPIAASAIGFSEYLARAAPALVGASLEDPSGGSMLLKKLYAVVLIAVFSAIHLRGLELGARVQNVLTALKVVFVFGLIVAGFWLGSGDLNHLADGTDFAFDAAGWRTLGLALMWIMFAYSGWNAAAYIGSEVREPTRTLPRALLLGTASVTVMYVLINLLYVYAAAPQELSGVISVAGLAIGNLFGASLDRVLSLLISFALFSSLSAFIILGPRVYYAMARDGSFFSSAGVVHPRFGVPSNSVVLQGLVASAMVLLGTFDQILTYMGFSLGIFPLLAVAGVFRLRQRRLGSFRMPGFPLVPIVYMASAVAILTLSYFERPAESSIAVAMVVVGVPFYFVLTRGRRA